jgi:thiamine-monophosphate kinase
MPLPELLLIEKIRALAGRASPKHLQSGNVLGKIRKGIGDDCAVLAASKTHDLLVTTDLCIENVHFRTDWHSPASVGHRCLTRGLSDIAAMGGEPVAAFLSLGLPAHLSQKWVDGFFKGFERLAKQFALTLAGGDIATNPQGVVADIVVLGRTPKGKAVLRSGARPGDLIYVTGVLGRSMQVIAELTDQPRMSRASEFASAHYFPQPRIRVGQWLREHRAATAMTDISDGLSTDMEHICTESGVAAVLHGKSIPRDLSHMRTIAARRKEDALIFNLALHGGEDYELLFTAPRSKRIPAAIAEVPITRIGEIAHLERRAARLRIVQDDGRIEPLHQRGWEHFSSSGIRRNIV